ncbi:hypothetical protein OAS39_12160 [Pirellulales bacterium]|nr:hypothetical protein [Pirellulales bacterium]
MSRLFTVVCALAVLVSFVWAEEPDPTQPSQAEQERETQVAELEKMLSGATLVGHFTESGGEGTPKLTAEEYQLATVRHVGDGMWLFEARIRYGEHDLKLPLTLPVRWAGDTPVIVVDQLPVIGMGKFDARVMLFRDRYAGYWNGAGHGGHLFGEIKRPQAADEGAANSAQESPPQPN